LRVEHSVGVTGAFGRALFLSFIIGGDFVTSFF
jgi:hypothetical protein